MSTSLSPRLPDVLSKPQLYTLAEVPRAAVDMIALPLAMPALVKKKVEHGHPVLVVTGLWSVNAGTIEMRAALKLLGYPTHTPPEFTMLRTPSTIRRVVIAEVDKLHAQTGQKVSLIGWCVGGAFTRMAAFAVPDKVRQVVNLGSSREGWWYPKEHKYAGVEHLPVPSTVVYSRSDGMFEHHRVCEPDGPLNENLEIVSSHWGMANNPMTMRILADRLAQPEGQWAPYGAASAQVVSGEVLATSA
ncbi:MAG: hypothetical protein V9F82_12440 [Dermatophilaceae bacterium]